MAKKKASKGGENVLAVIDRLIELGWLKKSAPGFSVAGERTVDKAVKAFQRWAGLKPDGKVGPVTLRALFAPRVCGVADMVRAAGAPLCQWPRGHTVTWACESSVPGVTQGSFSAAMDWGFKQLSGACGFKAEYSGNSRTSNIYVQGVMLDGRFGVLADSQLPCGANERSRIRQRCDTSEPWELNPGKPQQGRISFPTVMLHELCHGVGMEHIPPSAGVALLNPTYSDQVLTLTALDIVELQKRYGPPTSEPPPPPPGEREYRIRCWGRQPVVEGT